jgi:hypothetical protein
MSAALLGGKLETLFSGDRFHALGFWFRRPHFADFGAA